MRAQPYSVSITFLFNLVFEVSIPAMASSVDAKLLKSTRFPPEFSQKVDLKKVNVEVMKKCRAHLLIDEGGCN